ncbi:MAG: RluA family pseudouridine synthase [Treponema sp.]|nr:RluA family pseudouridine synthase [Treponema sp.]
MKNVKLVAGANIRLDAFLQANLNTAAEMEKTPLSNSKIRRLIIAGCVSVNNNQIRIPGYNLKPKSTVICRIEEEKALYNKAPDDVKFEVTEKSILYEDENLIYINKPAFFPTEPTIVKERDNLHAAIVRYLWNKNPSLRNPPYVGIMHRLDRETSGVILFTKNRTVNKAIFDLFNSKDVEEGKVRNINKTYIAVVQKSLFPQKRKKGYKFKVELYMNRVTSKSAGCKWGIVPADKGGLYSLTEFEVKEVKADKVYLYAHPVTGRTHQIRVHLASLGCPIIGDSIYSKPDKRLMLHAFQLEIPHPVTGQKFTVTADCDF